MEQIAMAVIASQPATDARPTAAGPGQAKAGGLFDILMAQELSKLSETIKGLPKKNNEACDPMMIWLMSALIQGVPVGHGEQGQAAQPDGGQELLEVVDATHAEQPSAEEGGAAQAGAAAALLTWVAANPEQFQGIVADLKAGGMGADGLVTALGGAISNEMAQSSPVIPLTPQQKTEFTALIQSMVSEEGQASSANPMQGSGNAALEQIKRLFAQAIANEAGEPEHKPSETAEGAWRQRIQAVAQPDAKPAGMQEIMAARQNFEFVGTAFVEIPVAPQTADPGKSGEGLAKGGADGASAKDSATEAGKETEILPFQAAMKAYHFATPASGRNDAPSAEVAAAARPGAEAFESIVQSITGLKDSAAKEMQIQLKPEFLGKVTISLLMEEGGLVAKIAAANPRVQDVFMNQAVSLQSVLAEQGLKDVRVVVTSSSVQDPNLQQQADRRSHHQQQQQKRGRFAVQGVETAAAPALRAYEALTGAGAINYLA